MLDDGSVDVEASLKLIADTETPSHVGVGDRHQQEREQKSFGSNTSTPFDAAQGKPLSTSQDRQQLDDMGGRAGSAYQQARAMKEKYLAMQAKISYEKEVGILLVASDVRFAIADGDAIIRNRLESLPDILAPQLAAETDEQKIRNMLADQIETLLGELSRRFNAMAKI